MARLQIHVVLASCSCLLIVHMLSIRMTFMRLHDMSMKDFFGLFFLPLNFFLPICLYFLYQSVHNSLRTFFFTILSIWPKLNDQKVGRNCFRERRRWEKVRP
ncbi:hypothetical protein RND81_10G025500 [Saponaria officinalis]|uniref:Uncharacterized protein n=1 Tax=Saponaria officinalis TaxID=3572 RepID=A0AAW1HZV5_SAPOF